MKSIYLDYNATTPLDDRVKEAMLPCLEQIFGNPSSIHHVGRRARALLDECRERVAVVWQVKPGEVVFTSGGTESNNLAILGTARMLKSRGRHLITSTIEHHAVLHCFDYLARREGFDVTHLPVNSRGLISPGDLRKAIRPETILVSLMAANNEIGSIQPVSELGSICREAGIVFHTDAIQWFGKEPFTSVKQFNADLVSCCAHKFHGPKGAGALYIRSSLHPYPILLGGSHENERRAGTENLAAIAGLALASELFLSPPVFSRPVLEPLSSRLVSACLKIDGVAVRSHPCSGLSNTVSLTINRADSLTVLANLDLEGFCASSGSACSTGSLSPSHVLEAIGVPATESAALIRFSLGRDTTAAEIERLISSLPDVVLRSQLPA